MLSTVLCAFINNPIYKAGIYFWFVLKVVQKKTDNLTKATYYLVLPHVLQFKIE